MIFLDNWLLAQNCEKLYDIKPYLDKGVFSKLKDVNIFNSVKVTYGTVSWGDDIAMCADSLYESGTKI